MKASGDTNRGNGFPSGMNCMSVQNTNEQLLAKAAGAKKSITDGSSQYYWPTMLRKIP